MPVKDGSWRSHAGKDQRSNWREQIMDDIQYQYVMITETWIGKLTVQLRNPTSLYQTGKWDTRRQKKNWKKKILPSSYLICASAYDRHLSLFFPTTSLKNIIHLKQTAYLFSLSKQTHTHYRSFFIIVPITFLAGREMPLKLIHIGSTSLSLSLFLVKHTTSEQASGCYEFAIKKKINPQFRASCSMHVFFVSQPPCCERKK